MRALRFAIAFAWPIEAAGLRSALRALEHDPASARNRVVAGNQGVPFGVENSRGRP